MLVATASNWMFLIVFMKSGTFWRLQLSAGSMHWSGRIIAIRVAAHLHREHAPACNYCSACHAQCNDATSAPRRGGLQLEGMGKKGLVILWTC